MVKITGDQSLFGLNGAQCSPEQDRLQEIPCKLNSAAGLKANGLRSGQISAAPAWQRHSNSRDQSREFAGTEHGEENAFCGEGMFYPVCGSGWGEYHIHDTIDRIAKFLLSARFGDGKLTPLPEAAAPYSMIAARKSAV